MNENYNDFIIKYPYEDILFLTNFTINYMVENKNNENILTFAMVKVESIEEKTEEENNIKDKHQISLETFQIKVEPKSFNIYYYEKKKEIASNTKNFSDEAMAENNIVEDNNNQEITSQMVNNEVVENNEENNE